MRQIRHNSLVLAAALLLAGVAGTAAQSPWAGEQPREMTGSVEAVPSPDGRLELLWRRNETQSVHEIWVRLAKDPRETWLVYSYIRSASVLWAPNGRLLAITDRYSSHETRVVLMYFSDSTASRPVTTVAEEIEKYFDDKKGRPLFSQSHARAVRWSPDGNTLQVQLNASDAIDGSNSRLNTLVDIVVPVLSAGE